MNKVTEEFSSMVFDEATMKKRLPAEVFEVVKAMLRRGKRLDIDTANVIANAMKDWAIEKGATHYSHWFQPMTGVTAEKHDSFISPTSDGKIIMKFSGKELVRGEPDASSFPSGGLRATFEARGYTAWDPTSFAFVKDDTLYIPTAFCSYGGEALDKKTPLLRSMEVIGKQALRTLKLFGNENVTSVKTTVGPEQEYFLVDRELYEKRPDLIFTGRTLFGAKPPKGQELDDHYFGAIKSRVKAFMKEVDEELWRLGVLAKTEHNEAAPAQHELAPVFTTTNIATDHNQLTMEIMQKVAAKHGMVCLLHEKPYDSISGSGKHNNWSMSTDTGINLFEPGETPFENAQFLLFLTAVIKAVDDYQDLLRLSVASAGNDHRLGANEAPPAIISIFLGDELTSVIEAIEKDGSYSAKDEEMMKIGVHVLPKFPKDSTDRNRTSPFAFTGNKFEFRMLGSSASVADVNIVLNTAVAQVLKEFSDLLENVSPEEFNAALHNLIRDNIIKHKRILFNGNGYDDAWVAEAEKRGLLNLKTTVDAIPYYIAEKNIKLFADNKVYNAAEINARYEIMSENYSKILNIEALTMIDMTKSAILPAVAKYLGDITNSALAVKSFMPNADISYQTESIARISELLGIANENLKKLESALDFSKNISGALEKAVAYKDNVISAMDELRPVVDELETIVSKDYWPYPGYADLLFGIK